MGKQVPKNHHGLNSSAFLFFYFNNDDGDGNEDFKKIGQKSTIFIKQNNNFALASSISLPSLHGYDMKIPNFTFSRGCKQTTTNFSFSFLT